MTIAKRSFDLVVATVGLGVLLPVLVSIALLCLLLQGLPILFLQPRVGRKGAIFKIWKFRTMVSSAVALGPSVTAQNDSRITALGRLLRKYKLDELPQLVNVLKGDMSFVGPRPEVPKYVNLYQADQRAVLDLTPGITDLATLEFANEEALLASVKNPEEYYITECVPKKIDLNLRYARSATLRSDVWIMVKTVMRIVGR